MSLAKLLNLNKYDASELQEVYKCTKCCRVLKNSVYKRCSHCRSVQTSYMQRYRYGQDHTLNLLDTGKINKIDNNFEEFLRLVKENDEVDIMKLVLSIDIEEFIIPKLESLVNKKKLVKIHYINRIFAVMSDKFLFRSSCIKSQKLYMQYICLNDIKLKRNTEEKLNCCSKLSLGLDLISNSMKIEFSHKCHKRILDRF